MLVCSNEREKMLSYIGHTLTRAETMNRKKKKEDKLLPKYQLKDEQFYTKLNTSFRNEILGLETSIPYPKVAGEEFRTSGGTYAAVPTNVQALSSTENIKISFSSYCSSGTGL